MTSVTQGFYLRAHASAEMSASGFARHGFDIATGQADILELAIRKARQSVARHAALVPADEGVGNAGHQGIDPGMGRVFAGICESGHLKGPCSTRGVIFGCAIELGGHGQTGKPASLHSPYAFYAWVRRYLNRCFCCFMLAAHMTASADMRLFGKVLPIN
jgi:hypothetical protein